jgi:moderate conductance mechanosensitive channel
MPDSFKVLFTSPALDVELKLVGLLVLFFIVQIVLQWLTNLIGKRLDVRVSDLERRARLRTILKAVRDIAIGIVLIAVLAEGLQALGLDVRVLLASVGVIGLVVSVSVQNFIRDYVGGVLIVAENQFHLGELIEANGKKGRVERITLRATYLRDEDGTLHLISNGEMRVVSNLSRKRMP